MIRRDLGIVHRPDGREWLRGVRTRNRMGGNMWECFPPFSTDPKLIEFGTRVIPRKTLAKGENNVRAIRQFNCRPTRGSFAVIKSTQDDILDIAINACGSVLRRRNDEASKPASRDWLLRKDRLRAMVQILYWSARSDLRDLSTHSPHRGRCSDFARHDNGRSCRGSSGNHRRESRFRNCPVGFGRRCDLVPRALLTLAPITNLRRR